MLEAILVYFGLPFGGLAAVAAAFVFLTPWGPAALAFVVNSKVARVLLAAAGAALAVGLACLKAFNAGKTKARVDLDRANAAAKVERQALEQQAASEPDAVLRSELGGWSPK